MSRALADIEAAVYAATRTVVGDAALKTGALVDAIRDRSARYTTDRAKLAKPTSPKADLAARAAFFTIADAMKIAIPLAELASRDAMPAARPVRVIDLGAGCGAMSLGLVASTDLPLAITAIDRDREALGIAAAAVRGLASAHATAAMADRVTITTRTDDATSAVLPNADLVVMGTLLNELATEAARLALVERALAAIGDDGAVIIVEPALRETTRALHELRDAIVTRHASGDDRGVHVFAPCTRQGVPCPALADPTDWCHEHRRVVLPPRTAELARLTHLRDDGLKFSYLVLRRQDHTLSDDLLAYRIVGTPWAQKGKLEVLGCGEAGRLPLRLLKRNRAPGNRALEAVERGDVVSVNALRDADRIEIIETTIVERFQPAEPERPAGRGRS